MAAALLLGNPVLAAPITLGGGGGVASPGLGPPPPPGRIDTPLTAAEIAILKNNPFEANCDGRVRRFDSPFKDLSDAEINAKIVVIRQMVKCVIDEMKKEDSVALQRVACCLQNLFNRNQLKIDFQLAGAFANTDSVDGSNECVRDQITIAGRTLMDHGPKDCDFTLFSDKPALLAQEMIRLFGVLAHEGLHAIQDWRFNPQPGDSDAVKEGRSLKVLQANEKVASTVQKLIMCDVLEALRTLRDSGNPPEKTDTKIGRTIATAAKAAGLTAAQLTELMRLIAAEKLRVTGLEECRAQHERAYCDFIEGGYGAGGAAVDKLNRDLRRTQWGRASYGSDFGPVIGTSRGGTTSRTGGDDVVYAPNNNIRQEALDMAIEFAVSGVDYVTGMILSDDASQLWVLGGEITTGDGLLVGYQDSDGDGLFDEATRTEAIRGFELEGATFAQDLAAGQTLIFSPATKEIFHLSSSGSAPHPFPDTIESRGYLGFDREDVRYIEISSDGLEVLGYTDQDLAVFANREVARATAAAVGGAFSPDGSFDLFAGGRFVPVFSRAPALGDMAVYLSASFAASLAVCAVEGGVETRIAAAVAGPEGEAVALLESPLQEGEILRIKDLSFQQISADQRVWPVLALRAGESLLDAEYFGVPLCGPRGALLQVGISPDLSGWTFLPDYLQLDGYGDGWIEARRSDYPEKIFFQAREVE